MNLPITEKPTGCRPTSLNCGRYSYFDLPWTQARVLRNSYGTLWSQQHWVRASVLVADGWHLFGSRTYVCGHHDVGLSVLITYRECTSARETLIVVTSQRLKSQAMRQLVQQLVQTNNKETPNPTLLATHVQPHRWPVMLKAFPCYHLWVMTSPWTLGFPHRDIM